MSPSSRVPKTVADLVAAHPASMRVLRRHQISSHVASRRALAVACAEAGVTVETLLAEVAREEQAAGASWDWSRSSLATIVATIVERWHRSLEAELPELHALAGVAARLHPRPPFPELVQVIGALRDDLAPHLLLEECVIFPLILDGMGQIGLSRTLRAEEEHAYVAELLERVRTLTDNFALPSDADSVTRQLWAALEALERELGEHLAVEVDVLFPRALTGEDPQRPGLQIGEHAPPEAPTDPTSQPVAPPRSRG